jgi:hypothetical protein
LIASLAMLAAVPTASAVPITYSVSWEMTVTSSEIVSLPFNVSFDGATGNVEDTASGFFNEPLAGTLDGPSGINATTSVGMVGIQPETFGTSQSLVFDFGSGLAVDVFAGPVADYDLQTATGPVELTGSFTEFALLQSLTSGLNVVDDFSAERNYTFEAVTTAGEMISYDFGWTLSATSTTSMDALFEIAFTGNTDNIATAPGGGLMIEGLAGSLAGSLGASSTTAGAIAIQSPGPGQSLLLGFGDFLTLDLEPGELAGYDLTSAGAVSLTGTVAEFGLLTSLATALGFQLEDPSARRAFSFEAVAQPVSVPEPGSLLLLSGCLAGLVLAGRFRQQHTC